MRGEWIEISSSVARKRITRSLPMRGEWIEIGGKRTETWTKPSLPMRGEWIEISSAVGESIQTVPVSPHAGRVD